MGGKFLIRIEDTDKERNTPDAIEAIFTGLAWLGLDPDEDIVLQSRNAARHVEVANQLIDQGMAYYDPNNVNEEGQRAVRIRGIKCEQTIEDLVQGKVTWRQDIDDFVILRSDGTPTYMLAVVADDHDMGVTHVIRGDDHLNNAFRQLSIYKAMNWPIPQYGHIPLIHGEDGKKLSKRTGAASVDEYRMDMGILAPAMVNYLARLGWGHGNDELFTMEQAIEWFDIKDVGKGAARLDRKKLASINGHYIRNTEPEILARNWVGPLLHEQGIDWDDATLVGAMAALRERSTDLNALAKGTQFLWDLRPIFIEEKAREKLDTKILEELDELLVGTPWDKEHLEHRVKAYAEVMGHKLGVVAGVLRAALTGSTISPPIFDVMVLLGMEQTLGRIRDAK